jgi:hypothetical protein
MNNTVTDPKTATPAEIDAIWLPLEAKLGSIKMRLASFAATRDDSTKKEYERARAAQSYDSYKALTAVEVETLKAQIAPFQAEWDSRKGWTRYILCATDGGHVHSTEVHCSTLRFNTRVGILPSLSGLTAAQMVDEMGFKACTVCFPFAPTTPAWARTEKAAAADKDAAKAAKLAKGLAIREKKVMNIQKRIAKATAALGQPDEYGNAAGSEKHTARYNLEWNQRDLVWAQRELDRWLAK